MKKHPEYMILIAIGVALVLSIIAGAMSCAAVTAAVGSAASSGTQNIEDLIDDIEGHGDGNGGDDVGQVPGGGMYTEEDVPETMVIDVPELQDDLQAVINNDIEKKLGLGSEAEITITELTKDEVGKPELKNRFVLSQAKGKATVKTADGKTQTIDYTSYYYADDPTAEKVTWYIYGYDLSSYEPFPEGFEEIAGDPMNARDFLEGNVSAYDGLLGNGGNVTSV